MIKGWSTNHPLILVALIYFVRLENAIAMKQREILVLALMLIALAGLACSSRDDDAIGESPVATPTVSTVAAPLTSTTSSPLSPAANIPATAGTARGKLIIQDKPADGVILYLAETVKDDSGQEVFVSMSRTSSPKAITDNEGNFSFSNVAPGKYGLVLDTVIDSYLLYYPGTEKVVLVVITAEGPTDLGTLSYEQLPLP